MFIGHFAFGFLLSYIFPSVPLWIILIGVSFPDILWPIFVILGIETVRVDRNSPLQKNLEFTNYPYSHSLVLTTAIATAVGILLSVLLKNELIILVFPLSSASHWLLDAIVHRKDLPLLGFSSKDIKVGLGLWNHGKSAFVIEYAFYAVLTLIFIPLSYAINLLILGSVFHLLNANSFLGFTKNNPFGTNKYAYPLVTLAGFGLFILIVSLWVI